METFLEDESLLPQEMTALYEPRPNFPVDTLFPLIQLLSPEGQLKEEAKRWVTKELTQRFYTALWRARAFDRKCLSLQRQGRIGTYAPFEGQEATQVGAALALEYDDWLFPTYRDHAATMTFGQSLKHILLYWMGRHEGSVPTNEKKILPPSVPIATHLPHAVGVGYAAKIARSREVVLVLFGDGATSEGDFHEALNIASVWRVPAIFLNQNNQYAISVPLHKQMFSRTIAQKALAYDVPGLRVDGNDVFAVYTAVKVAAKRARAGLGPTLIEALTWRYGAHTTSDDPKKYRDQQTSEDNRRQEDPLLRIEKLLRQQGWDDPSWLGDMKKQVDQEIEDAIQEVEQESGADPAMMFDYVFATRPWTIQKQKERLLNYG